ncbi:molybdopterin-dependent oxidoreductase [Terrabacter sp. 2RAF25]|uniref:molybdopterin-dependent oxidoreductase n=1 Tax=Terrabacter sp. 2RAF25 TaxID=3232998 RepID=UPI003F991CF3
MAASTRPGRGTNLALLVLLAGSFLTGWVAFGVGVAPGSRLVAVAHGTLGLGILLLAPWKSVIVGRGLRRRRRHGVAVALVLVLAASLLAGVVHSVFGPLCVGAVSALALHVAFAVVVVPLALGHVVRRPQRVRGSDLSRRTALRAMTFGGTALLAYAALSSVTSAAGLPGARRRETGSYEVGSGDPTTVPVTQWFTDGVPDIDPAAFVLRIERPDQPGQQLSYDALLTAAVTTRAAVIDCTGGWWSEQTWRGVRLDTVLGPLGPLDHGSIVVRSLTGYTRRFPAEEASALMLATHMGGVPLSPGHGGPVRLVAPGRRGFWWVKWVSDVSVDARPWWTQPPFPLQ